MNRSVTPTSGPRLESWETFRERLRKDWQQGEHASVIGSTGGGKSYLAARGLLPLWKHSLTLDIKGDDPELIKMPAKMVKEYPKARESGFLFKGDPYSTAGFESDSFRIVPGHSQAVARATFHDALGRAFTDGQWLIYLDELRWLTDPKYLGLGADVERLWLFGRSRGLTILSATQAPRWVPSAFYEQARHHFIFGTTKKAVLKRLSEIDNDQDDIEEIVKSLGDFEFLYVGPRFAAISRVTP